MKINDNNNTETNFNRHKSVMLTEAIEALNIKPEGIYIDATFGCGGHSKAILKKLGNLGKLLVIDLDLDAIKLANSLKSNDSRVMVAHGSFKDLISICSKFNISQIDGILLDLGVSSPQLDDPNKGFSFSKEGPLDLRMDASAGRSASEWLASVTFEELYLVLKNYGEERFAKRIAAAIIDFRNNQPIKTTLDLANLIKKIYPIKNKERKHPATRTFQAIRIHINQELDSLKAVLPQAINLLKQNGRLVLISFHSLEDRIVKEFIFNHSRLITNNFLRKLPQEFFKTEQIIDLRNLGKFKPQQEEIVANVRSRSAIMRVAEKCA